MNKALIVTTVASTIYSFCMNDISLLQQHYNVHIATSFDDSNIPVEKIEEFKSILDSSGVIANDVKFNRNPFAKDNYRAYVRLKGLIDSNGYDIIHCHTPVAAMITRLAARKARRNKTKVIYTAHGFHFYKGAPITNWLLYYPVEWFLSRYTDVLITINKEDFKRASNHLGAKKTEYIPGVGIDVERFSAKRPFQESVGLEKSKGTADSRMAMKTSLGIPREKESMRDSLGVPRSAFLLISVGELNKNKNHETVIKAIIKLDNPDIYYVVCGKGSLESYLSNLIDKSGLKDNVKLLGFRKDIPQLCLASDLFVFPSFREGLPVSVMEAMAAGLPVVCSNIRGNNDLIENDLGGYLIKPSDADGFATAIGKIYENPSLREKLGYHNKDRIAGFSIHNVGEKMRQIYSDIGKS